MFQVKVWFQNRRTKFKRTIAEKSDGSIVVDDYGDMDELDPCGPDSEPSSPLATHPHDIHLSRGDGQVDKEGGRLCFRYGGPSERFI